LILKVNLEKHETKQQKTMSAIFLSSLATLFLLLQTAPASGVQLQLISSFQGLVGAGNSSYFTLHEDGRIKLEVTTVEGDADLYVCEKQRKCDWSNYYLQSITYGLDEVVVEKALKRPVNNIF